MSLAQMIRAIMDYREVTINGHKVIERGGIYKVLDMFGIVIFSGSARDVYNFVRQH